jgi:hypothetical protein
MSQGASTPEPCLAAALSPMRQDHEVGTRSWDPPSTSGGMHNSAIRSARRVRQGEGRKVTEAQASRHRGGEVVRDVFDPVPGRGRRSCAITLYGFNSELFFCRGAELANMHADYDGARVLNAEEQKKDELRQYERYQRRELLRVVRRNLEDMVSGFAGPLEDKLRAEVVGIIRKSQLEVFESYKRDREVPDRASEEPDNSYPPLNRQNDQTPSAWTPSESEEPQSSGYDATRPRPTMIKSYIHDQQQTPLSDLEQTPLSDLEPVGPVSSVSEAGADLFDPGAFSSLLSQVEGTIGGSMQHDYSWDDVAFAGQHLDGGYAPVEHYYVSPADTSTHDDVSLTNLSSGRASVVPEEQYPEPTFLKVLPQRTQAPVYVTPEQAIPDNHVNSIPPPPNADDFNMDEFIWWPREAPGGGNGPRQNVA